jgi:hypothetical protein
MLQSVIVVDSWNSLLLAYQTFGLTLNLTQPAWIADHHYTEGLASDQKLKMVIGLDTEWFDANTGIPSSSSIRWKGCSILQVSHYRTLCSMDSDASSLQLDVHNEHDHHHRLRIDLDE